MKGAIEHIKSLMSIKNIIIVSLFLVLLLQFIYFSFELNEKEKLLVTLNTKLDDFKEQIETLSKKNTTLEENINKLNEDLKAKDDLIASYEEEIVKLKEALNKATNKDNHKPLSNRSLSSREKIKKALFEVTMYTNDEGAYSKNSPYFGTMANGEKTHIGAVAGPKALPFGTKIMFENLPKGWESLGKGYFVVKDRGGAIVEKSVNGQTVYCIDVYIGNKTIAKNWGRRLVEGYIILP